MRRNEPGSKHVKTETRWHGAALKVSSLRNKHVTASAARFQNNDRSCLEHHPQVSNLVWSYHLIKMLRAHGLVISILTVIDEHTQECLLSLAADHISTENVIDELFSLFLKRGIPKYLFAFDDEDSMPKAICEWLEKLELSSTFVELKKYGESGYGALFKDKLIRDLLQEKRFASLDEVKLWLANWRDEHNSTINLW